MTIEPDDVPDASEQLDQIQPEDSLVDRGVDDVLDEGYTTSEGWSAAERYGNTPYEEAVGETLDQRIAQEEPEPSIDDDTETLDDGEVGDERAGRLVDPNEGIGIDDESELLGDEVGIDGAGASAEEAAVHIVSGDDDSADDAELDDLSDEWNDELLED